MLKYQKNSWDRIVKLSIDEYCKRFKMSKEMVQSKIRSKNIESVIEGSELFILIEDKIKKEENSIISIQKNDITKPKTTVATVIALYQKENNFLKNKIAQLEAKVDKLIDDKEQMLRDELDKIEQIYSSKDTQLKNILELVNKKLDLERKTTTIHEIESFHHTNELETTDKEEIVELKEYLKSLDMRSSQRKIVKKQFLDAYDNDVRVIYKEGKLYLNFSKYDYSDLLAF
jgi:hypothetical protein